MMKAEYSLETHTGAGFHARQTFEGTRPEARAACRAIDTNRHGERISNQTTCIRFVRYK